MQQFFEILGYLLQDANRNPNAIDKEEFYALKKKLLLQYGQHIEQHVQHIEKECFSCDGTGMYYEDDECYKCSGTGYYLNLWSVLDFYKIGNAHFHMPVRKVYSDPGPSFKEAKQIEGFVTHKKTDIPVSTEAFLWLALFFDRKIFWQIFGYSYRDNPLVLTLFSNIAYSYHYSWKDWFKKQKRYLFKKLKIKELNLMYAEAYSDDFDCYSEQDDYYEDIDWHQEYDEYDEQDMFEQNFSSDNDNVPDDWDSDIPPF